MDNLVDCLARFDLYQSVHVILSAAKDPPLERWRPKLRILRSFLPQDDNLAQTSEYFLDSPLAHPLTS
jgi:hypothetical protein